MGNRGPVGKKDRGLRGHVIWDGKPLTSGKKGSQAQGSRDLGWETADQWEKGIAGSGWEKPLGSVGSKSKVQFTHREEV